MLRNGWKKPLGDDDTKVRALSIMVVTGTHSLSQLEEGDIMQANGISAEIATEIRRILSEHLAEFLVQAP